jgi:hypothetical protein
MGAADPPTTSSSWWQMGSRLKPTEEGETETRIFDLIGDFRLERAALSLIHFLRDQSQSQSEWLDVVSADQTMSPPRRIRQRTLQLARE